VVVAKALSHVQQEDVGLLSPLPGSIVTPMGLVLILGFSATLQLRDIKPQQPLRT
jgi:hypothetical protein